MKVTKVHNVCKRGHLLSRDNIYINKKTGRIRCKVCTQISNRNWLKKNLLKKRLYDLQYSRNHYKTGKPPVK